jgi:hypothetical protein
LRCSAAWWIKERSLAKPNYRHEKKQREAARKARQDAKQQRRAGVVPEAPAAPEAPAVGIKPLG